MTVMLSAWTRNLYNSLLIKGGNFSDGAGIHSFLWTAQSPRDVKLTRKKTISVDHWGCILSKWGLPPAICIYIYICTISLYGISHLYIGL